MYKNDWVDHLLVNHEKWNLQVDWGLQYCNWLDHPKLVCEKSCDYFVGDSCSILAGFTIRGVVDDIGQSIFANPRLALIWITKVQDRITNLAASGFPIFFPLSTCLLGLGT